MTRKKSGYNMVGGIATSPALLVMTKEEMLVLSLPCLFCETCACESRWRESTWCRQVNKLNKVHSCKQPNGYWMWECPT